MRSGIFTRAQGSIYTPGMAQTYHPNASPYQPAATAFAMSYQQVCDRPEPTGIGII